MSESIDDEVVLVVFQASRPPSSRPHRRGPRLSPTLFGGQLSTCFRRSSTGLSQQSLPWLNISRTSTFGGYPDISFYLGVQVHHYSPGLNISTMLPTSGRLISGSFHLPASNICDACLAYVDRHTLKSSSCSRFAFPPGPPLLASASRLASCSEAALLSTFQRRLQVSEHRLVYSAFRSFSGYRSLGVPWLSMRRVSLCLAPVLQRGRCTSEWTNFTYTFTMLIYIYQTTRYCLLLLLIPNCMLTSKSLSECARSTPQASRATPNSAFTSSAISSTNTSIPVVYVAPAGTTHKLQMKTQAA